MQSANKLFIVIGSFNEFIHECSYLTSCKLGLMVYASFQHRELVEEANEYECSIKSITKTALATISA
jgi:hypothetical protein